MLKKVNFEANLHQKSFYFFLLIVLSIGIFFRFVNLAGGSYFRDEAYTLFRVAGYTQQQIIEQAFTGNVIPAEALQKYQDLAPGTNFFDTIESLAKEDAQHPPLYYILARLWEQCFGSSLVAVRCLSAILSLLAFPCIYWLCRELFESAQVGWLAIAMVAVLPLYLIPAQTARQYSFWTVAILFSSAALLKAIRRPTPINWGIYATTITINLYTGLFSAFFFIAHGIYVAVVERWRMSKVAKGYFIASAIGIVSFLPWIIVIINRLQTIDSTTSWIADKNNSWIFLIYTWLMNLGANFIYSGRLGLPFALIALYAVYFICRKTRKQTWIFILLLIAIPSLALMLPDLIVGGQRSTVSRYFIPSYLGIQISLAYLLTNKVFTYTPNRWRHKVWYLVLAIVISTGIVSGIKSLIDGGWDRGDRQNIPTAQVINQAKNPLVIADAHRSKNGTVGYDGSVAALIALSDRLDPDVKLQLVIEPNIPTIPKHFEQVFLYSPSPSLMSGIQQTYAVEAVSSVKEGYLWKLKSKVAPSQVGIYTDSTSH